MTTISYSAFLDDVIPDVGGVSVDVATHAIQNACIQFCEQTNFLQEIQDPLALVAGTSTFDLYAPAQMRVMKVLEVWSPRMYSLTPRNAAWLRSKYPNWGDWTGVPRYYNMPNETQIRLVPYPDASSTIDPTLDQITITVTYKPTRSSTAVDRRLYDEHLETIAAGAKYRLMSSPAKPYTNVDLASLHFKTFWAGVGKARRDVNAALSNAQQRVTPLKAA